MIDSRVGRAEAESGVMDTKRSAVMN
jgi:hypothetical protein